MSPESRSLLVTSEARALALRMAKHFGHKVEVEQAHGVTRIRMPAGQLELVPGDAVLELRATAEDGPGLARVQEVAASHLARFARAKNVEVDWASG